MLVEEDTAVDGNASDAAAKSNVRSSANRDSTSNDAHKTKASVVQDEHQSLPNSHKPKSDKKSRSRRWSKVHQDDGSEVSVISQGRKTASDKSSDSRVSQKHGGNRSDHKKLSRKDSSKGNWSDHKKSSRKDSSKGKDCKEDRHWHDGDGRNYSWNRSRNRYDNQSRSYYNDGDQSRGRDWYGNRSRSYYIGYEGRSRNWDWYDDQSKYHCNRHHQQVDYSSDRNYQQNPPNPTRLPPGLPPIPPEHQKRPNKLNKARDMAAATIKTVFQISVESLERRDRFLDRVTVEYRKFYPSEGTRHYKVFHENMVLIHAKFNTNERMLDYQTELFLGKIRPFLTMPPPPPVVDLSRGTEDHQALAEASKLLESSRDQVQRSVSGGNNEGWRSDDEMDTCEI